MRNSDSYKAYHIHYTRRRKKPKKILVGTLLWGTPEGGPWGHPSYSPPALGLPSGGVKKSLFFFSKFLKTDGDSKDITGDIK